MFVGDIMMHARQIDGARYDDRYDYNPCFQYIRDVFDSEDFVIGNLECTFSGSPYSGYPNFRAPDELAGALKLAGFNCLLTANNHAFDGGKHGLRRTLQALDTLQIAHTGTFTDSLQREERMPLILESNNIRIALLNYTYGTNYFPAGDSAMVSRIRKAQIAEDVEKARSQRVDQIVACFHWGREYESVPDESQTELVTFCQNLGVDLIVGSHPHILQPIKSVADSTGTILNLIAYSLGNFISDYVTPERTGGAILKIVLEKHANSVTIAEAGYILTWVVRISDGNRQRYYIVPADRPESMANSKMTAEQDKRRQRFLKYARKLLQNDAAFMSEYRWNAENKFWYLKPAE